MPRKRKGKSKSSGASSGTPKEPDSNDAGVHYLMQSDSQAVSNEESFPSQVIIHGDLLEEDKYDEPQTVTEYVSSFSSPAQKSESHFSNPGDEWTVVKRPQNKQKSQSKLCSFEEKSQSVIQKTETLHQQQVLPTSTVGIYHEETVSTHASGVKALAPPGASEMDNVTDNLSSLSFHFNESSQNTGVTVAKRPGFGTKGRPIELIANYFLLKLRGNDIYQYDVEISAPSSRGKEEKSLMSQKWNIKDEKDISHVEIQQKRNVGKQKCREIIDKLIGNGAFQKYRPAYDGQRNLYTAMKLPITGKTTFKVDLTEDERKKTFLVTIQPVERNGSGNAISLEPLKEVYRGRSREIPQDIIMAFDTILCHRDPPFNQVAVGRSFFFFTEFRRNPLDGHTEIWTGYNQSVHLTQKGPAVVVNLAAKAFHTASFVINYACEVLGFDITSRLLRPEHIKTLTNALCKIRVEATHLPYPRKYTIQSVSELSARDQKMSFNGQKLSVAKYFLERYKALKFPDLPCLSMRSSGKPTFMPMEVCFILPGQPHLGKLDKVQLSEMIQCTAVPPNERFRSLEDHAKIITDISGESMKHFGIHMETQLMSLTGRVLDPPQLAYKDQNCAQPDAKGTWKMDGKHFYQSATGIRWIILSFAKESSLKHLSELSEKLMEASEKVGLYLQSPVGIEILDHKTSVFDALNYAKKIGVNFALVILSRTDEEHTYEQVKFVADKQLDLITQCMDDKIVQKCCVLSNHLRITTNLCLKLNSKLGGINHIFSKKPSLLVEPLVIMGADAAHSPRGSKCPSIAAVVGCLDDVLSKYAVTCRIQENPDKTKMSQEIILEMKNMAKEILMSYKSKNTSPPKRIVFFRDGVSEGQFQIVLETELGLIQHACREVFGTVLPVTFIVIQKRHQTRIRPRDSRDGVGRMGNVPAGTIVDTAIVHPVYYDFYICSHEGIQGTTKPTRYVIIHDDSKFDPDEIQNLCYHLCHIYARCNRSISIPPPVMYAHLAAARAKKYVDLYLSHNTSGMSDENFLPKEVTDAVNNMSTIEASMFFI